MSTFFSQLLIFFTHKQSKSQTNAGRPFGSCFMRVFAYAAGVAVNSS